MPIKHLTKTATHFFPLISTPAQLFSVLPALKSYAQWSSSVLGVHKTALKSSAQWNSSVLGVQKTTEEFHAQPTWPLAAGELGLDYHTQWTPTHTHPVGWVLTACWAQTATYSFIHLGGLRKMFNSSNVDYPESVVHIIGYISCLLTSINAYMKNTYW